jgi:hypothetical protein
LENEEKIMTTYRIADLNNGPFSEEFETLQAAETALAECIQEGTEINQANGEANAAAMAKEFFCIVDAQTGEEI